MAERTANEMWIQTQIEMTQVEEMARKLVQHDSATYGGPYDYCRQVDEINQRIKDDIRHALASAMYLKYRLQAFFEIKEGAAARPGKGEPT